MKTGSFTANIIAKGLGLFWFLDGLLQLQLAMFGPQFPTNVLVPNLSSQPHFMQAIVFAGIHLWNTNTVLTNSAAALLQIVIGVLLFLPLSSKSFKVGLWISIIWGIIVWFCGEGAGALLTGSASFYSGAPGAVLIYVLIAVVLLFPERISVYALPKITGWILVLCSALQLQSAYWTADGVQGAAMSGMMDQVHAITVFPLMIYNMLPIHPIASNLMLFCIPLFLGLALILKPMRVTGMLALIFLFFVWWLGQDFGQLSTIIGGTATDPQAAPLFALCILPIFLKAHQEPHVSEIKTA